jgi:hypothetical protein
MTSVTSIEEPQVNGRSVMLFEEPTDLSADLRFSFDVRIVSPYFAGEPQMASRLKLEIAHLAALGMYSAE